MNKSIAAYKIELKNVFGRCYPSFVWKDRADVGDGDIIVFTFHDAQARDFEEKLQFLKVNGYHTAVSDELYSHMREERRLPEKTILITFDDGRASVWRVAYPLLKKYGYRATVFLVPKIVRKDDRLSLNLIDADQGRCTIDEVNTQEPGHPPTVSWREALEMHESGVIDFQCHSLDHRRIPVGSRIRDFIHPGLIAEYFFSFDIPIMRDAEVEYDDFKAFLGAPVYESAPFMENRECYLEDIALRNACVDYVAQNGGERFFLDSSWRKRLFRWVDAGRNGAKVSGEYEAPGVQRERITSSLLKAKEMIETRLAGKTVRHLAYPWGQGSDLSAACSKEAGYVSNFWSTITRRSSNRPGDDPFRIVRLKHDFIWRLPGQGRKPLRHVFLFKAKRRIEGRIDY